MALDIRSTFDLADMPADATIRVASIPATEAFPAHTLVHASRSVSEWNVRSTADRATLWPLLRGKRLAGGYGALKRGE